MARVVCVCGETEMEFARLTQADFGDKGWVQDCCRAKAQAEVGAFQAEHHDEAHMAEMHTLQGLDSPEESLENLFTPEQETVIAETLEQVPAELDSPEMQILEDAKSLMFDMPAPVAAKGKKRGKKK